MADLLAELREFAVAVGAFADGGDDTIGLRAIDDAEVIGPARRCGVLRRSRCTNEQDREADDSMTMHMRSPARVGFRIVGASTVIIRIVKATGLDRALSIGRKRRRKGQLWPMPVRETDLGHICADITIRPIPGSSKSWTGRALLDTGATDTFLPATTLRKLGVKPVGKRKYGMADGTLHELPIGFGVVEVGGRLAGATLVFANDEALLGVTVLESTGFWIDPQRERLIPRPPKRK